jgi:hypothetical protein
LVIIDSFLMIFNEFVVHRSWNVHPHRVIFCVKNMQIVSLWLNWWLRVNVEACDDYTDEDQDDHADNDGEFYPFVVSFFFVLLALELNEEIWSIVKAVLALQRWNWVCRKRVLIKIIHIVFINFYATMCFA